MNALRITKRGLLIAALMCMLLFGGIGLQRTPLIVAANLLLLLLAAESFFLARDIRAYRKGSLTFRWQENGRPQESKISPRQLDAVFSSKDKKASHLQHISLVHTGPFSVDFPSHLLVTPGQTPYRGTLVPKGFGRGFIFGLRGTLLSPFHTFRHTLFFPAEKALLLAPRTQSLPRKHRLVRATQSKIRTRDSEHIREYQRGEDPRWIDWKASARRGKWMIRFGEESFFRHMMIVADFGASTRSWASNSQSHSRAIDTIVLRTLAEINTAERQGLKTQVAVVDGNHLRIAPPMSLDDYEEWLCNAMSPYEEALSPMNEDALYQLVERLTRYHDPAFRGRRHPESAYHLADTLSVIFGEGEHDLAHDRSERRFRHYLAIKGVPLPHRNASNLGDAERGMQKLFSHLAQNRQRTVIRMISDLDDFRTPEVLFPEIHRLQREGHRFEMVRVLNPARLQLDESRPIDASYAASLRDHERLWQALVKRQGISLENL